jgi:hypothetical protein
MEELFAPAGEHQSGLASLQLRRIPVPSLFLRVYSVKHRKLIVGAEFQRYRGHGHRQEIWDRPQDLHGVHE